MKTPARNHPSLIDFSTRGALKRAVAVVLLSLFALGTAPAQDPTEGTFTRTADMTSPRERHTATLLVDGQVLITGGNTEVGQNPNPTNTAEVFNPLSFPRSTPLNPMTLARSAHTATLLDAGGKVLVAGGTSTAGVVTKTAEVFDPALGIFRPVLPMITQRSGHTATRLPDGKVLIAGGDMGSEPVDTGNIFTPNGPNTVQSPQYYHRPTENAERFDPTTEVFTAVESMGVKRAGHTATLIVAADGKQKVLITGGVVDNERAVTNTAELFDPESGTFTELLPMRIERAGHTATLLQNGKVLIAGGTSTEGLVTNTAELFDPALEIFIPVVPGMFEMRSDHAATLLPDGRVLIAGGNTGSEPTKTGETFDPALAIFLPLLPTPPSTENTMTVARYYHRPTLVVATPSGRIKVLVTGGITDRVNSEGITELVVTRTAELFNAGCPADGCFTLEAPGDAEFWDGPYIDSAQVPAPEQCDVTGPCFQYQLTVGEGGSRLRVGFDAVLQGFRSFADAVGISPPGARFRIQVKGPAQTIHEVCLYSAECPGGSNPIAPTGSYSTELFVPSPEAGVWTVLVIPTDVTDLAFRMRAKLEPPPVAGPVRLQLPNLRLIPPYEPTFIAPAYEFGPAGPPGVSCMPGEIAEEGAAGGATGCLRFSAGVQTNGEGWFAVQFFTEPIPQFCDPLSGEVSGEVFQRLFYSHHTADDPHFLDCTPAADPEGPCKGRQSAGCAVLRPSYSGFYYEGIYRYTLFEVTDLSTGTLEPVQGGGQKRGFAPADDKMADWDRFYQGPRDAAVASSESLFSLTAGWGDIHDWNRSGQYVDFNNAADGFYVIRGVADFDDNVLESDEDDNTGYALVFVQGETVDLCERGYGESPWDPNKVLLSLSAEISSDALATQLSGPCALAIGRSAVSRKTHNTAGNFDINLPLTGSAGIECRTGGANGNHQIVITFATAVTVNGNQNPKATLTASNGGSVDTVEVNNAVVTVNLKEVGNQQTVTLTLHNVDDGTNTADVVIPMGVLLGDTNANGAVNSSDIGQTKSHSGQAADASNFRSDVTGNGVINASDIGLVKSKSGTALP